MNFKKKYENQKKTNNFIHQTWLLKKTLANTCSTNNSFSLRFKLKNMDRKHCHR